MGSQQRRGSKRSPFLFLFPFSNFTFATALDHPNHTCYQPGTYFTATATFLKSWRMTSACYLVGTLPSHGSPLVKHRSLFFCIQSNFQPSQSSLPVLTHSRNRSGPLLYQNNKTTQSPAYFVPDIQLVSLEVCFLFSHRRPKPASSVPRPHPSLGPSPGPSPNPSLGSRY